MVELVSASVVLVVIKACIDTVIMVKTLIEDVRFNRERCQELARSCIRVENVLKQQEGYDLNYNIQYYEALKSLQEALSDARDLIYQHLHKGTIHRAINRREYERDFDNLRRRIHEGISLLNLSVSYKIHYLVNDLVQSSKGSLTLSQANKPAARTQEVQERDREQSLLLQGQMDKLSLADEDRYGRSDPDGRRAHEDMRKKVQKALDGREVDGDYLAEMVRLNNQMMGYSSETSSPSASSPAGGSRVSQRPDIPSPSSGRYATTTTSSSTPPDPFKSQSSPPPVPQGPIYPPVPPAVTEEVLVTLDFNGMTLTPDVAVKLIRLFDANQNGFLNNQEYRSMVDFIYGMQLAFHMSNPQGTGVLMGPHELAQALFAAEFHYSYEVSLMFFRKYATINELTLTKCIYLIDFINITVDLCTVRNRFCWSDEEGRNSLRLNFDQFLGLSFGNTSSEFL